MLAAAGALVSDLMAHHQAMFHTDSRGFDVDGVNAVLADLERRCRAFADEHRRRPVGGRDRLVDRGPLSRPGVGDRGAAPRRAASAAADDVAALVADFHRTHREVFAVDDPTSAIETVGWNADGPLPDRRLRAGPRARGAIGVERLPARPVYFAGTGWTDAAVHRFEALTEADAVVGPAVVESDFTSIVIDPGFSARRDAMGTLVVDMRGERA